MTKPLDPDVKVLRACVRAIEASSSERMKKANVELLYDRYIRNPPERDRGARPMSESLTLKWGTLKSWDLQEDGPAFAALKRYHEQPVSMGAAQQSDTPEQKEAICEIIDALDNETVYLSWDGEDVSKDRAKRYVMEYPR